MSPTPVGDAMPMRRALRCVLAVALLGTLLAAASPAQACSFTGAPTGCATLLYLQAKGYANQRLVAAQGWGQQAAVHEGACAPAGADASFPGLGPESDAAQAYASGLQQDARDLQAGAHTPGPALGGFVGGAWYRTLGLVLAEDGRLDGALLGAAPDPAAGLPTGAEQPFTDEAQLFAARAGQDAQAAALCASQPPPPPL
jgi:hypothetical protein